MALTIEQIEGSFSFARGLKAPIWVYDIERQQIAFANAPACELWNAASEEELRERSISSGIPKRLSKHLEEVRRGLETADECDEELWTLYRDNEPLTVNVAFSKILLDDGRAALMCEVTGSPILDNRHIRGVDALVHTDVSIALFSGAGEVLYQNPAAQALLIQKGMIGSELFASKRDLAQARRAWFKNECFRDLVRLSIDKEESWFDLSVIRCLDVITGEPAALVTAFDVSDLKSTADRANYLAARDQLTNCFNRAHLQTRLKEICAAKQETNYAILFIDIDRFKSINDTYGHPIGDWVVKRFANRLNDYASSNDLVARMGGDEFVFLIHGVSCDDDLQAKIRALHQSLNRPIKNEELSLDLSASIGVTKFNPSEENDWAAALKRADMALYHSKRSGRNQYTVYTAEIGAAETERQWLEKELALAFERNEFEIYYQPRIDLGSNDVIAAEALLRWPHEERGFISPAKFIPVCEDTGLIEDIGSMVLHSACRQLAEWEEAGFSISVSINVSANQLQNDRLVEELEAIAASSEFDISKLELEITESSFVGDNPAIEARLHRINELGVSIALDDFGTAYSNLAHLSRYPIQCIKLDGSFIRQLPSSGPLLKLIMAMAQQMDARIVAEGVETVAQLGWLKYYHCDEVQGFYFSEAVPAHALIDTCAQQKLRWRHENSVTYALQHVFSS